MPQKRHSVDQIIAKLRKADVLLGKGTKVAERSPEGDYYAKGVMLRRRNGHVQLTQETAMGISSRASGIV